MGIGLEKVPQTLPVSTLPWLAYRGWQGPTTAVEIQEEKSNQRPRSPSHSDHGMFALSWTVPLQTDQSVARLS